MSSQREAQSSIPMRSISGAPRAQPIHAAAARPALYYLPFATGLRPLEVARLTVGDYPLEDGSVRSRGCAPMSRSTAGDRPLFFNHRRLDEALGAYLDERVRAGHGLSRRALARPGSAMARRSRARRARSIRSRRTAARARTAYVCRPLLEIYRKIFRQADIPDCARSRRG